MPRVQALKKIFFLFKNKNIILFFFFFLVFLGPPLRHMEVPRLGVELELQLLIYATATATGDPSRMQLTPQLIATPDPYPTERAQRSNPRPEY